jgi:hypothetical protein
MPDVIFNIVADTTQLESTIPLLEKLGQVDKKTAEQFRAATEEYKKSAGIISQATQAQVQASEKFAAGAKGIDLLSKSLKELGISIPKDQLKQFAEGVMLGLDDAMKDAGASAKGTTKNLGDLAKAVQGAGGKGLLTNFFDQSASVVKTGNALQTLKQKVIEARNEAQRLAVSLGSDAKETIAAQKNLANLTHELDEFNQRTKSFNPENKFVAISSAFQGIAGSVAIASGALTLFGADTKEAEELTKKLDAALKLTAGFSAITQLGGEFKNLGLALGLLQPQIAKTAAANVILAESEVAAGAGGVAAAGGVTAFSTALRLSPIGFFVTILSAAAAAYFLLSESATDAEKAQEKLNAEMQKGTDNSQKEIQQVKVLVEEYKASNTTKERQTEILKTLNESYPSYFKNLSVEKTSITDLTAAYEKLVSALVLKSQLDSIINAAAANRIERDKQANQKDSEAVIIANKLAASVLGAKAFETQADKVRKLDAEYKTLIDTAATLSKTLDTAGGDPSKKEDKKENPRVKAIKKDLQDEAKLREELRKKELAADLENLKIYVANRKTQITESNATQEQKAKELSALELAQLQLRLLYYQQYGEDVGDVLNQIADFQAKVDKEAADASKAETDALFAEWERETQGFIDKEQKKLDEQKAFEEKRNEILLQAGLELVDGLFAIQQAGFENQIEEISKQADREKAIQDAALQKNKEDFDKRKITAKEFRATEERLNKEKVDSEKRAQQQINDIKRKADTANRIQKLFEIAVATARNIVENPLLALFYGLLGATQAGIVLATPLPQYAKGTLNLQGKDDAIPIIAHRGEAIIPADRSKDYHPALKAITNRSIPSFAMNEFVRTFSVKDIPKYTTNNTSTTTNFINEDSLADKIGKNIAWELRNNGEVKITNWRQIANAMNTNDIRKGNR